jgi:hypothetical protein
VGLRLVIGVSVTAGVSVAGAGVEATGFGVGVCFAQPAAANPTSVATATSAIRRSPPRFIGIPGSFSVWVDF